jgi:hypothetical protein
MSVQVNCPHCLTPCEVPDNHADKVLSCGNCQKTFRLKGAPKPPHQTPPLAPAVKAPEKPRASDIVKAGKPAAPPRPAPKKAAAIDVLEVVDVAEEVQPAEPLPKKRARRVGEADAVVEMVAEPPKKRSKALLVLGCLGLMAFAFVGSAGAAAAAFWYLNPAWLGFHNSNTVVQNSQPATDKGTDGKRGDDKSADKAADKHNGDKDADKPSDKPADERLSVLNFPPATVEKDKPYAHQVAVKSTKGGVRYKLDAAPPGMTISPDGKISWTVPADFDKTEAEATLTVSDASGQSVSQPFKVALPWKAVSGGPDTPGDTGPVKGVVQAPKDPKPMLTDRPATEPVLKTDKLVNPPGLKLDIKTAPLAEDTATLLLPAPVTGVCVGGGGRFLIFHAPKAGKLIVFDVNEARVVKYLDVGEGKCLFAAGMTKLLLVLPERNVLQRWSLLNFEREVAVPLPVKGAVNAVAMGSASAGPLIVGGTGDNPTEGIVFLDIQTLKPIAVEKIANDTALGFDQRKGLRVSPDGSVMTNWYRFNGSGAYSVLLAGNSYQSFLDANIQIEVVPSPDGKTLFTADGFYTAQLKKLTKEKPNGTPVPAPQGQMYVTVFRPDGDKNASLSFHLTGDGRALHTLSRLEGLDPGVDVGGGALPWDRRVFLNPQAKLLAMLSGAGDKLYLQRFDLDAALEKSGVDYLVVTSQCDSAAVRGAPFAYQLQVKSKKGGVKYKLGSAPKGMVVSPEGKVTWDVPADYPGNEADVSLSIADASGQEISHEFKIALAAPAKPGNEVTRGRFEIKRPMLKADKEERRLNATTDEVCLGGGGRFVLLSQPKDQKVAVFDVNEAEVVRYLDIGEDLVKMTAGMDKLFVAVPAKGVIQRWDLHTFEKEVTQTLTFKGTLTEICMGHAARSPLVAVFKEVDPGRGNIKYLDPDTLKPVDLEYTDKTAIFAGRGVKASADGRVFAASVDNQHVSTLELSGKTARSRVINSMTNLAWPSVDGRTIFTATDAFTGPDFKSKVGLDTSSFPAVTLPFVPARQGELFMRLDDHVTREMMKIPTPKPPYKEGGDLLFYLPGQKTQFATWRDFDGVFGKLLLAGGKSLSADERYILLPDAGVLITIPATNASVVLYRFDLDDLLAKYGKDYLFVASTPVTLATKGRTYTYPVAVKSKKPNVNYTLAKSPPGMKITTEGKLIWDVPGDFAGDEAEVILNVSDKQNTTVVQHTFKITVEK